MLGESINKIEETYRNLKNAGRPILKLFSGNPNEHGFLFPPEILKTVYQKYFATQDYQPHSKGLIEARQSVAEYYRNAGVLADPEHILLTSGTSESFLYLFTLLTEPGDNILIPHPGYPLFDEIARLARITLKPYRLEEEKDWAPNIHDLSEKADAKTKALVLISPHNPTGAVLTAKQIQEMTEWANMKNIPLICDEVFSEFYFGEGSFPRPCAVAKPKLCFTLNGISKMFALPALKLSWILVSGEKEKSARAVERLETIADTFLSCHIPIQKALPYLFQDGKKFLEFYRSEVRQRRDLALKILRESSAFQIVEPQGGFYMTIKVVKPLPFDEEEFVIALMKKIGVFVHPGYFYDCENGFYFVISFLTEERKLQKGLEHLAMFVNQP